MYFLKTVIGNIQLWKTEIQFQLTLNNIPEKPPKITEIFKTMLKVNINISEMKLQF